MIVDFITQSYLTQTGEFSHILTNICSVLTFFINLHVDFNK